MYKLGHLENSTWVEHIHPATFYLSELEHGVRRLVAGAPNGNSQVFSKLVEALEPPYCLLYVLHTPRGDELLGRYQSPAISATEFRDFIAEFSPYLSGDARFDMWAHSTAGNATIVWDRHNQIFGYGPMPRFALLLTELGFEQGAVEVPVPHTHNYHKEFDSQAARLLQAFEWSYSPLREEDQQ
jgi:hypothetical protein